MDVKEAIERRRALRSLVPVEITDEFINDLAANAQLAPSCFNNQPWNFIFVRGEERLREMHEVLSRGNAWAQKGSLIVVVIAKRDDDCVIGDREYFLFDTGLATANLILRATELGLIAHPIAGYSPSKTREVLSIPEDMEVVTLVIVGKHSGDEDELSEERPARKALEDFIHIDGYREE